MSGGARSIAVAALVPYPPGTTPSQRFRLEQWRPHLSDGGITLDLIPFLHEAEMGVLHRPGHWLGKTLGLAQATLRRAALVTRLGHYDAVIVHRAACLAGPALLERGLALTGKPIIFDFDDAIFRLHTTHANRHVGWLKFPGKTAAICRLSAHVVAGNSWLAEFARGHNNRVTVIPSSVDLARYGPRTRSESGKVVVGWTGSSTSQTYLEAFAPMLRELTQRRGTQVELRIHSDRQPHLPGIPYVWRQWSPETEVAEIAAFDVGIMPMPDEVWSRGKCAMKALLYMAAGVPAVCTALGANSELIEHGRNGLLAEDEADWHVALGSLIDDPALRIRLGAEGRRTVESGYSMTRCADRFAKVIRSVVEGPSSSRGSSLTASRRGQHE